MTQAELNPALASDPAQAVERQLDRFESLWRLGTVPDLNSFLPTAGSPFRQTLLHELIKIDLEFRWRRAQTEPGLSDAIGTHPQVETYVTNFPELGSVEEIPNDLIVEEYWVRQRFGDRPEIVEYANRFPTQGERLLYALQETHSELDLEFAPTDGSRSRSSKLSAPVEAEGPIPPVTTIAEFVERVRRLELLGDRDLEEFVNIVAPRFTDLRPLARELLMRGWMTPYQLNHLLKGRDTDLVLDAYLILERLGEGSTGWVYKARHQRMNRLVALKILRRELLADPELLARFYREIQVVSQLQHPNVVLAYDAGPMEGRHVLVMEYAEGTDLACLIREQGPLSIPEACDYIAQTASGLQHIHEQALVHRDIKPSNLLRIADYGLRIERESADRHAQSAIIKILDLGLARLGRVACGLPAGAPLPSGNSSGRLTPNSAIVVGTPDFLAPEQAMDFHAADIRADIYSLGCTLYYLLVGKPPFPATTLTAKLLRHQQDEPPSLTDVRRDAPAWLNRILHKMLAKDPRDRYQTPIDVVRALTIAPIAANETIQQADPTVLPTIEEIQLPKPSLEEVLLMGAIFQPEQVAAPRPRSHPVLEGGTSSRTRYVKLLVAAVLLVAVIGIASWLVLSGGAGSSRRSSDSTIRKPAPKPLTRVLNFNNGFEGAKGLALNGSAFIRDGTLILTPAEDSQCGSAFSSKRLNAAHFLSEFRFQLKRGKNPEMADGFTFTIQNVTPQSLGSSGGGLGYGPDPQDTQNRSAIPLSVAVKFDLFDNIGEGDNCTGVFTNGASPSIGGYNPFSGTTDFRGSGIDLHSGHIFRATIGYENSVLKCTQTDSTTGRTATQFYRIDIPDTLRSTSGYVGFTASTGGMNATQTILSWTYATPH